MSNKPDRPDWPCACVGDHRMTIGRAWCGDCTEWCYPNTAMLCVRGQFVLYEEALRTIAGSEDIEVARDTAIDVLHADPIPEA